MANISIRHNHTLLADEVRDKTQSLIEDVKREFPKLVKDVRWNRENTCAQVTGKAFSGTFSMQGETLHIEIKLSLMARPFKSLVEKKIQNRLREHFP